MTITPKVYRFLRYQFTINMSAPKTAWFYNTGGKNNLRLDTLFGINRFYSRKHRQYVWNIVIGRLSLIIGTIY